MSSPLLMTIRSAVRTVEGVDRDAVLRELPPQYEVALRMAAAGATQHQIGMALGIEPEAVGPLMRIAEAKMRRALETHRDTSRMTNDENAS